MARDNLTKYTLSYDDRKETWTLTNDKTDRTVKTFDTKAEAIQGGVLEQAVGKEGGSVKIQKLDGKYQEERTYPRSKDPTSSKG
ncbi:MAG: DUF2188 domain-containing protein [Cyanosarcina radialis HA8281-LM2]|jgi:hypothetical protein|nr:DUF2188 domain-containing protein [Cyanosarcina radialis HA8281-LM2]